MTLRRVAAGAAGIATVVIVPSLLTGSREAFEHFDEIWEELDFEERQYAVRLPVKEIELHFEKGQSEGEMKIEPWGRRPTPLPVELRDYRSTKLRNQDGKYPRLDSNQ